MGNAWHINVQTGENKGATLVITRDHQTQANTAENYVQFMLFRVTALKQLTNHSKGLT